jgi:hypothetical protein
MSLLPIRISLEFLRSRGSCWLAGPDTCLSCRNQLYFPYCLIEGGSWRSGWTWIKHPFGGPTWWHNLLDFLEQILHGAGVFHRNLESLPGRGRIHCLHQLVVEVSLVDNLSRMAHQLPDSAQHQILLRLIPPDSSLFWVSSRVIATTCAANCAFSVSSASTFDRSVFLANSRRMFPGLQIPQRPA